jgi:ankyrin repeat protein
MKARTSVWAVLATLAFTAAVPASPPESPVADAASRGDLELVRTLLRQGADANTPQGDGMTALHWAAQSGNAAMADVLIRAGAIVTATTRLGAYTPLHLASANGRADVVQVLLAAGSSPAALTSTGVTALHMAADAGNAQVISALLAKGADVNAKDRYSERTPLMFAAARNRVEAVRVLLAGGADWKATTTVVDYNERAKTDRTDSQLRQLRVDAVRGVRNAAAPPADASGGGGGGGGRAQGAGGGGGGGGAAGGGGGQTAQVQNTTPQSYDETVGKQGGLGALHYAARDGHADVVRMLLDAGADVNQLTAGDRSTPLLVAVINGNFDLAAMLLERGANPTIASEDGVAPLFAAVNTEWALRTWYPQPTAYQQQKTSYLDLMRALLQGGADPDARLSQHLWYASYNTGRLGVDYTGATAFWRAAYALDVAAMKLLVEFGADPNLPTLKMEAGRPDATDPSGLPPVPSGGPGVYPLHAAAGVGFGTSRVGQQHRHVPDGWLPAVKYLVEELGADVNARDLEGFSAVHHAAARGDNDVILFLVSKGADVTTVSRRGQTTVDMANGPQQRVQPFPATIALLESMGAKNNHKCQSC